MITNARVLQPEFIPAEIKHRDAETSHLSHALEPVTRGERGETALLYGPSGVGKTCVAKFTVEQLRETAFDVDSQYVNCWEDYSRFKTLYRLLDGVGKTLDIHRQSTPTDVLLDRLRNYDGGHYVAILDEVDQLEEKRLLYDLSRIQHVTLVLIANREEELFEPLDDRIQSRLSGSARIRFGQYSTDELGAILSDRVQAGLRSGVIDEDGLELIADAAAGDARAAISILRNAARTATRNDQDDISTEIIQDAVPEAKSEMREKSLDRLTSDQQTLYEILEETGEIGAGDLYDHYRERVSDPKTKRMVRNYLSKMEHYNLIVSLGATRGRTYKLA